MATYAARRLHDMADNTAAIVAIELLAAAQGVDLRRPLKTSPKLQQAMALLRRKVRFWPPTTARWRRISRRRRRWSVGAFEPLAAARLKA